MNISYKYNEKRYYYYLHWTQHEKTYTASFKFIWERGLYETTLDTQCIARGKAIAKFQEVKRQGAKNLWLDYRTELRINEKDFIIKEYEESHDGLGN